MAFTNIIDIIYPVGSVYSSTSSTSPATLFGGTWTQINGAVLAAYNSINANTPYAKPGTYGGDTIIHIKQLPKNAYSIPLIGTWNYKSISGGGLLSSTYHWSNIGDEQSGGSVSAYRTGVDECTLDSSRRGGQDYFLPYHFGCYVWYRIA